MALRQEYVCQVEETAGRPYSCVRVDKKRLVEVTSERFPWTLGYSSGGPCKELSFPPEWGVMPLDSYQQRTDIIVTYLLLANTLVAERGKGKIREDRMTLRCASREWRWLDQTGCSGGKEKGLDSRYILKKEFRDFLIDWRWNVKQRRGKNVLKVFNLNN